jgi:hypothetical protein
MKAFKKIATRIIALVVLLIGMNFFYATYLFEGDLQKYSPMIKQLRTIPQKTDVLYFGESSNLTSAETDTDKRKISELVSDYYPGLTITDITKDAAHAGIYLSYLKNIPKDKDIKTVVITLNLRSFGAAWIHSELESSLQRDAVLMGDAPPFIKRLFLSFRNYDVKSGQERILDMKSRWTREILHLPGKFPYKNVVEWDDAVAATGIKNDDGSIDAKTNLACSYIKSYGFQIDTLTNPRVEDFNEIVNYAKARGWNIVFNLLAENMQKARELVGENLIYLMEQNGTLLTEYYSRKGVAVVDNLNVLESHCFIDQDWTTEHYTETGRKTIAKNIAEAILIFH